MYSGKSLNEFIEKLGSTAAVPGGGGASAAAGAMGAALAAMAAGLTAGKKKYAAVDGDMRRIGAEAGEISRRLAELVDGDAEAFEPLSRAYRMDKDAPGRAEVMEKALCRAAEPPMEMLRLCCRTIELAAELAEKCGDLVLSDAGCAAVLCWGAMYSAALNVLVNTKSMADRAYAGELNRQVEELMQKYRTVAEKTYESVYGRLK